MSAEQEDHGESTRMAVFDAVVATLEGRRDEEGFTEVTEWVTATQIANDMNLDKDVVVTALEALGEGRLHVQRQDGSDELVVIGVDHRNDEETSDAEGAVT